jgi:hypothetical protein
MNVYRYHFPSEAGGRNVSASSGVEQDAWGDVDSLRLEIEEAAVDPDEMDRIYEMVPAQRQVSTPSDFGGGEAGYQLAADMLEGEPATSWLAQMLMVEGEPTVRWLAHMLKPRSNTRALVGACAGLPLQTLSRTLKVTAAEI